MKEYSVKEYSSKSFYQTKLLFSESYCQMLLQTFSRKTVPENTSFSLRYELTLILIGYKECKEYL